VSVIALGAMLAGKKVAIFVQKGLRMYLDVRDLSCPAYLYSFRAAKWPLRMYIPISVQETEFGFGRLAAMWVLRKFCMKCWQIEKQVQEISVGIFQEI